MGTGSPHLLFLNAEKPFFSVGFIVLRSEMNQNSVRFIVFSPPAAGKTRPKKVNAGDLTVQKRDCATY